MVVDAVAGWASPPLEVSVAPPLEVVVSVALSAMFLGHFVPAMTQRDHKVAQWP